MEQFERVSLISGEGNGNPLQYSCLANPMDGGACWAAVQGVAKSRTRLSDFTFTFHFHALEKEMATHSSVLAGRIPGTGEPWWAAVYGVTQSWTRLKQLSSSSVYASVLLSPLSYPPYHPCPLVSSLCLCLHCCFANRFISTIFLDSIYIC